MKWTLLILAIGFSACKPSSQIGELVGVQKITSLDGSNWMLIELNGEPLSLDNKRPTLSFRNGNEIQGFSGCNSFSGPYEQTGKHLLHVGSLISTKMFCEQAKDLEPAFLKILSEVDNFEFIDHQLILYRNKQVLARFSSIGENTGQD